MIYLVRLPAAGKGRKELEHRAAWALLAYALEKEGRRPFSVDSLSYGPQGKPCLEGGPFFSVSHTKGLALCAVEDWETGADVEYRRTLSPAVKSRVFTTGERALADAQPDPDAAYTALWTLKESYMKYTGLGLRQGAGSIGFLTLGPEPLLEGGGAVFRQAFWQGYSIAQCGPAGFRLRLCPVGLERLGLGIPGA